MTTTRKLPPAEIRAVTPPAITSPNFSAVVDVTSVFSAVKVDIKWGTMAQ